MQLTNDCSLHCLPVVVLIYTTVLTTVLLYAYVYLSLQAQYSIVDSSVVQ